LALLSIALIVAICNIGFGQVGVIDPIAVSGAGTFNNDVSLVTDGTFPGEGSVWTGSTNMWWNGQTGTGGVVVTIDLGKVHVVSDAEMSFDNNDTYAVDYSLDGTTWTNLFTVLSSYGEIFNGMDTFSTYPESPEYVSQIDFAPVQAQFLRIYAVSGDSAYSIGEFEASIGAVLPDSVSITRGSYVSGSISALATSDDVDLSLRRNVSDIQSRTEFVVTSFSPVANPAMIGFQLEGSVFARSTVIESVEYYNYVTDQWELVYSGPASEFSDGGIWSMNAGEDLNRYVDQVTLSVEARIRYQSLNQRQNFASNTDQFMWWIG
jgi:hypothetical protein